MKSKFKSEKSNKNKHQFNLVLKEKDKKDIEIDMVSVMCPLNICLHILHICTCQNYDSFITKHCF